jgi:tocopherol O-methyltransferase
MLMPSTDYHKRIVDYYTSTENAYKDSWDLGNSLAIHYGYWDEKVKSFPQSLARMNEIMAEAAAIKAGDQVLDAGCGVGGSSIFLAATIGARVTGITLSERQALQANINAEKKGMTTLADFRVLNYCDTGLPPGSFDVVWGCESICYADSKEQFINEAFRLLRPGGRLVVADGFVTAFEHNDHPLIRRWLDGWQVNYLETPERFGSFMQQAGFMDVQYKDISKQASHSSRRLYRIYYLASLYLLWKKLTFTSRATDMQRKNINACKYQYLGMKKGLWQYGLITGCKPG